jgi:ribonuclease HII
MKLKSKPTFDEERKLWEKGFKYVIGVDEVGRGCFAGPIVAAAVVFKVNMDEQRLGGVNDSKQVKFLDRRRLSKTIIKECEQWAIRAVPVSVINKVGIGQANKIAFRKVIAEVMRKLETNKAFVLVDGFHIKFVKGVGLKNEKAIIKGDQTSFSIAAASVIAKDHRDKIMLCYSKIYKEYGFGRNKGYGTKEHQ